MIEGPGAGGGHRLRREVLDKTVSPLAEGQGPRWRIHSQGVAGRRVNQRMKEQGHP